VCRPGRLNILKKPTRGGKPRKKSKIPPAPLGTWKGRAAHEKKVKKQKAAGVKKGKGFLWVTGGKGG